MLKRAQKTFKNVFFCKKLEWSKKSSQVFRNIKHGKFHLEGLPKVPTALDFSKKSEFVFFLEKEINLFRKTLWKLSETLNFASFLIEMRLEFYYCSWVLENFKIFVFFGKREGFYSKNSCNFTKSLNKDTFLQKLFQKLFPLMQSQNVKSWVFPGKMMFFRRKVPWNFSRARCFAFFI